MILTWELAVWLCLGVLIYTYVGYPIIVYLAVKIKQAARSISFSKKRPEVEDSQFEWPAISILIPAFNEASVIRKKAENTLDLDYPKDRLEIVIVSDGSTDETDAMLESYGEREVRFVKRPERSGKTAVLNHLIPQLRGEIIILSDASGLIKKDALKKLVQHYRNEEIGAVCGTYIIDNEDHSLRGVTEKFYWQYETFLKRYESRLHSAIGAHGALYSFRSKLFVRLPEKAINDDFILPMTILQQGFRVLYEPDARVEEHESTTLQGEFQRRTRINVGNFQQIYLLRKLLSPKFGVIAFQFFSHKIIRILSPFIILALPFATSLSNGFFYDAMLALQIAFFLAAFVGYIQELIGLRYRFLYLPFYFMVGIFSAVAGFFRFLFGRQSLLWKKV